MEGTAVCLAVKLSPREVAALRAALRHVQHEAGGPSELARIELDEGAWLTDGEIDSVVSVLTSASEFLVITASGASVRVDDPRAQLLREAHELLNDPESRLDVRDWNRAVRFHLRVESAPIVRTAVAPTAQRAVLVTPDPRD
jgi:hypothetical protein